jgi:hypothetical protein
MTSGASVLHEIPSGGLIASRALAEIRRVAATLPPHCVQPFYDALSRTFRANANGLILVVRLAASGADNPVFCADLSERFHALVASAAHHFEPVPHGLDPAALDSAGASWPALANESSACGARPTTEAAQKS